MKLLSWCDWMPCGHPTSKLIGCAFKDEPDPDDASEHDNNATSA